METLEQLEISVDKLLARYKALQAENADLRSELGGLVEEKNALADENHKLKAAAAIQEATRAEALRRIEGLLQKIQDFDSVE